MQFEARRFATSRILNQRLHELVPGGAHTYAKGDDQYPEGMAPVIVRGSGSHVWDVDGNEFIEYGMGLRSVGLGHGFGPVVEAARAELANGANFVRPSAVELAAAESLLELLPEADMVKFAKNGSDATTAAVKLARAATGRDLIAVTHEHPFHSTDDWFIGLTPMNAGIPDAHRSLTVRFHYNDLASLEALFDQHPGRIAAVMMEPVKEDVPTPGFLAGVQRLCHRHGAVFVLDEIITGFRLHNRGGSGYYGIRPDLATWGKAMGNGFSVAALTGRRELMQLGGLGHAHDRVFLLSTTHGAETHCLAACMAVIETYERRPVVDQLFAQGLRLRVGVNGLVERHGIEGYFEVRGLDANLVFVTRDERMQPSQPFRTLFLQEMLLRGVLAPSFVISYSHTDEDVDRTLEAVDGALRIYARALDEGVESFLHGRPVQPVMRRRNATGAATRATRP